MPWRSGQGWPSRRWLCALLRRHRSQANRQSSTGTIASTARRRSSSRRSPSPRSVAFCKPEAGITRIRCRSEQQLIAAQAREYGPEARSSGEDCPDWRRAMPGQERKTVRLKADTTYGCYVRLRDGRLDARLRLAAGRRFLGRVVLTKRCDIRSRSSRMSRLTRLSRTRTHG